MSNDPYRFVDQRYYTPEADDAAVSYDTVPENNPDQATNYSAPKPNKPLPKPALWGLALVGGIAAVAIMRMTKRSHYTPTQTA